MIQFEDLKFTEDQWNPNKIICNKHVGPGLRLSVIQGPDCYCDKHTYESNIKRKGDCLLAKGQVYNRDHGN